LSLKSAAVAGRAALQRAAMRISSSGTLFTPTQFPTNPTRSPTKFPTPKKISKFIVIQTPLVLLGEQKIFALHEKYKALTKVPTLQTTMSHNILFMNSFSPHVSSTYYTS
jgi:hypothetical protein